MALTVLVSSLLLGGGLGSLTSSRLQGSMAKSVAWLSLSTALLVMLLGGRRGAPRAAGLPHGIPVSDFDPAGRGSWPGKARIGDVGHQRRCFSPGSALSMIVGISLGFSWALSLGSVFYAAAAMLFFTLPGGVRADQAQLGA